MYLRRPCSTMRHQVVYFLVISISQGGVSEFLPRWGKSYFQFMTSEKSKIKCSSFICLTIIWENLIFLTCLCIDLFQCPIVYTFYRRKHWGIFYHRCQTVHLSQPACDRYMSSPFASHCIPPISKYSKWYTTKMSKFIYWSFVRFDVKCVGGVDIMARNSGC